MRTRTVWLKKGLGAKKKESLKPPISSPSSSASGARSVHVMSVRCLSTSSSFSDSCAPSHTHKISHALFYLS